MSSEVNKIDEMLSYDPIAETEKQINKDHWSQFNDLDNMLCLINAIDYNQKKEDLLKSCADTYHNMSWEYFINLLGTHGFVEALTYDFKYDKNNTERAIVYYHPQKGLVVWATSWANKTRVNGGTLYGEIKANSEEDSRMVWRYLSTGGCIDVPNMIYETSHDVREGLFRKIERLESAGTWMPKWIEKDRFLWFVDCVEDDEPGYDYKAITAEKIQKCPKELREIMGR